MTKTTAPTEAGPEPRRVAEIVDDAPPLTASQREKLAAVLVDRGSEKASA
jgi:hypothetical protein